MKKTSSKDHKTPVKQNRKRKLSLMSSRIGGKGDNVSSSFDTQSPFTSENKKKEKKKHRKIIPTQIKNNNHEKKNTTTKTKKKEKSKKTSTLKRKIPIPNINNEEIIHTLTPKRKMKEEEIIHTLTPKRKIPLENNGNPKSKKKEKIHQLVPRKRHANDSEEKINTLVPRKKRKSSPETVHILKPKRKSDVALEEKKKKSTPTKRRSSIVDIPQPKKRQRLSRTLIIGSEEYEVEVQNHHRNINFFKEEVATVTCSVKSEVKWQNEVPGQISDLDINEQVLLCGTYNGTIHCFSTKSGRVLLGRHLQISSAPVTKISINEKNCAYILTKDGDICFLNINFQCPWRTRLEYRANVSPLLGRGDLIDACFVDNNLIVTLSDASLYTYTRNLECWACLSDNSFFGSKFIEGMILDKRRLKDTDKQIHTVNHIESELCNNLIMQRPKEFQSWCENYLQELLKKPIKITKLKEFCDELLQGETKTEITIFNAKWRRDLLKQLIPQIAQNRQLERIASRYVTLISDKEKSSRILLD